MTDRWQRQGKEQRVDSSARPEGLRPRISRSVPTAANACRFSRAALARSERDRKGGRWLIRVPQDSIALAATERPTLIMPLSLLVARTRLD